MKAEQFVKRYHTNVQIYYFERPTADDWCQELIEEVKVHQPHKVIECRAQEKEVRKNEPDSSIESSTQKYLEFLKNSY
jgi:hypothetical protein